MSDPPAFPRVGAPLLAKLLNISERRVRQLSQQGIIARCRVGEYDLCRSLHGYTAYLQSLVTAPDASTESVALQRQRVRLVKSQADRAEYLYRVESGQWVAQAQVDHAFQELAGIFLNSLDTLPGRSAVELVNLSEAAEIKMRLQAACQAVRQHIGVSLIGLGQTFRERAEASAFVSSEASADTESMGGCASEFTAGECRTGGLAEPADALHDADCSGLYPTGDQTGDCRDGEPDG